MNIEIGDIVYYNSPKSLETYGIVIRKAKWIEADGSEGEIFYYVREVYDKNIQDEIVYEDYIINLYKNTNLNVLKGE